MLQHHCSVDTVLFQCCSVVAYVLVVLLCCCSVVTVFDVVLLWCCCCYNVAVLLWCYSNVVVFAVLFPAALLAIIEKLV